MNRTLIATVALLTVPASVAWAATPEGPVAPPATEIDATQSPAAPADQATQNTAVAVDSPAAPPRAGAPASPVTPRVPPASSASVEPSPYGPPTPSDSKPAKPEDDEAKPEVPATLLDGNVDYAFGGMGGIGVMYTRIAGKDSPLICGEGAVIIDHALTLGGGVCGITRMLRAQDYSSTAYDENDRMTFGYGGAIGRYHFRSRKLVNVSVGALIGAGGVTTGSWTPRKGEDWEDQFDAERHDAVFVLEPQVGAHVNITRWLRLGAVAGYRIVSGVDTKGLSPGDLAGPTLGGQIQGGWF